MKMKAEVIEIASNGDVLTIALQGKVGRAGWKPIERQTLRIDNTLQNRKAFYIGRVVTLELKP